MIKVKDTKLSADIDDDVTEYVTFWGKLKGDIKKQKDLVDFINKNIKLLGADIKDELKKFSERVLEIKYDNEEILGVDEVDANEDKLIFKASNPASGNTQNISLLREEALKKYVDDKADDIANYVFEYILSKGIVDDPDYVHTDNNFSNAYKAKVDLIPGIQQGLEDIQYVVTEDHRTLDHVIDELAETELSVTAANQKITAVEEKTDILDDEVNEIKSKLEKDEKNIVNLWEMVGEDLYPPIYPLNIDDPSKEIEDGVYKLRFGKHGSEKYFEWVPVEDSEG